VPGLSLTPGLTLTGCRVQVKDNPEKDEHDVKKQEEVLAEYLGARVDEFERCSG